MSNRENKPSDLTKRHISEEIFHDTKYSEQINYPSHYRFHPTYTIFQEMKEMIGDVRGKKILEYGCGEGWTTAEIAALGGNIDSFDISPVAIEHAQRFLTKHNVNQKCILRKMAAECLDYPDDHFDIVIGFAILHHLDLDKAIPELFRVMKKGGIAYFAEPLGGNPMINAYRKLTPQYRTVDEKPLILDEFQKYAHCFYAFSHNEYYLIALIPLGLSFLNIPSNIINKLIKKSLTLDKLILATFPSLGKYAWYTILRLVK